MRNKQILLSGRAVTTNAANVPADRYSFLHLSDAEPNLGTASANGWVLVYDTETPGNRLWSKNLITAYDHANSAYDSQNATGSYANAAFLKANSAYGSQNVTGTYANNAYLHANAGFVKANSAYDSQNTTGSYANAAFLKANSAYASQNVTGTYANNAYVRANNSLNANVGGTVTGNVTIVGDLVSNTLTTTGSGGNITGANSIYANYIFANNIDLQLLTNTAYAQANAAFVKSNSAYDSQNTTGTYANAAFLKANSAYASQNVTGTYANNSYLHANAAFDQANSAYASQNVTGTYANNAYLHANSAYDSQNTTGSYANAAFLKANSAYESQNVTGTYANNAYLHANSAYDSQNTTGSYANAAFIQANSAYESQNVTGTYANASFVHANAAYDFANTRYSSSGGTISGSVTVTSNLTVLGNVTFVGNVTSLQVTGNSGQFFGDAANGFNALYAGIPVGYDFQPQTVFQVSANEDGYAQINIQNINGGGNASGDFVATADNGTEDDTYVDLGIGSSTHSDPDYTLVGPNDAYLYAYGNTSTGGGDLVLGTFLPQNDVIIAAGGMNIENEQMRIIGSSNTINVRANLDTSLAKSVLLGPISNVHITGGSDDDFIRTDGLGNLTYANLTSANVIKVLYATSNAAFVQANSAYESQNVTGTYANNAYLHANSAFDKANSAYASQNVTGTYANNAYLHANSAYESQNVTGTYANAAFLKANSAYESQNVTGTYANNAYLHANSSYESQNVTGTYANNAYLHANSAYDSQNTTGSYANAAFLKANSAYESQNVTGTYANNAYDQANSAAIYANGAFTQSNAAYVHANSSYESQNVTGTYANNAYDQANSAAIYANGSFVQSNSSYDHANASYASQNVTGTYANSAYDQANSAALYANGSFVEANAAFIKANAAVFSITTNVNELFSNTSSGNIRLGLATVNPNPGEWGSPSVVPVLTVDKFGRILSVYNTEIVVPPGTYIYPNTGQLTTNAHSGNVLIGLANVNSNIGSFGSEFAIPKISVDGYGRILNVANVTVSIPQGTYIVNSNLITANSQTGNVVLGLQESGVIAGTYGGENATPVIEIDVYGRIIYANNVSTIGSGAGTVNTLSSIVRTSYTATAGQTAFSTASSFENDYVDVYINGLHLSPADYAANGWLGQVVINNPTLLDGDVVDIQTVTTYTISSNTSYEKQTFVSTAGQTVFPFEYDPGNLNVYLNGLRLLDGTDYDGSSGINVVFPIALELNDIVEVEKIGRTEILFANSTFATRNTITVTANGDSTFIVGNGYKIGFTDVFLNGIKLNVPGDVTAINGNTITILSATTEVGDIIEINSIGPNYSTANAIPVTGGIVYGSLEILQNVSANHANVKTLHFADGSLMETASSGTGITWKIATANTTANAGEGVLVDTTSANVYITLNASPILGNTVRVVDMTGNFGINNCIIKRNGQKIMSLNEDLVLSTNNTGVGLVFSNSTHGWRIIENL